MGGDCRLHEIAAQPPDARERALLVSARKAAVADNIRDQDGRELSGLAHRIASSARHYHQRDGGEQFLEINRIGGGKQPGPVMRWARIESIIQMQSV